MALLEPLASFFHPSMAYKLPERLRDQFDVSVEPAQPRLALQAYPIVRVAAKPPTRSRYAFTVTAPSEWAPVVDGVVLEGASADA